jgi:hypothetical protein
VPLPPVADYLIYEDCAVPYNDTVVRDMIANKSRTYAIATLDQLNAMTTADFEKYKAIVFADQVGWLCRPEVYLEGAVNSSSVWSRAVLGNVVLMGTAEVMQVNYDGIGSALISAALDYVVGEPNKTGLYLSLSWWYYSLVDRPTRVPVLDPFGDFEVSGTFYAGTCSDGHIVMPSHPLVTGLTDEDFSYSSWSPFCPAREAFTSYPSSFQPVVIVTDQRWNTTFADGSVGAPYILARGAIQGSSQAPTRTPTTKAPTKNPTKAPTKNPTKAPTKKPTKAPTKKPTKSPTKNPTKAPTKNPTKSPTKNPTKAPTKRPTKVPAKFPTKRPARAPTSQPGPSPTAAPNQPRLVCTKLNRKCARPSECCAPANKACDAAPGKPRTCKVCLAAGRACARTAQCCAAGNKVCDGPAGNKTCKACLKKNSRCERSTQCCRGFSCKRGKCLP